MEQISEWSTYQVSYKTPLGNKQIGTITALSIKDARNTLKGCIRVDNNPWFDCTILRVWKAKPPTELQQLARQYGSILGGIKGAQKQFFASPLNMIVPDNKTKDKLEQAVALTQSQFLKLEREVRDVFKLAGLKVK